MKKIILILFLTFIFSEYNNPNGKPFTLNIKVNWEFHKNEYNNEWSDTGNSILYGRLDANMPITSLLTINGGVFIDRFERFTPEIFDIPFSRVSSLYPVFTVGAELHLPLYKIWEN